MELAETSEGVLVWVQEGGGSGIANAGVVIDDDGITIIDTLMVRSQWEPFAAAVDALGLPVRRVLLTHAHIDHVGGTTAFPKAAVYGSPQTSELLDSAMPVGAYQAFMPAFADEFDDLAEIGTRAVTHLIDDTASLTPRIEVLPATGHTQGDLIALVADADLCFTGDLCFFGVTPLAFQGDPAAWADVLDGVADLADTFVPGHGPVAKEQPLRDLQAYLRACVDADGDPRAIPAGPWDTWSDRTQRDEINVERAAMLARGDDRFPPSMLRALGLTP